MNKKNNSITLFLPSMFEDIPITIVRGIHNRQVLIDIQSKNVEVNRKGNYSLYLYIPMAAIPGSCTTRFSMLKPMEVIVK